MTEEDYSKWHTYGSRFLDPTTARGAPLRCKECKMKVRTYVRNPKFTTLRDGTIWREYDSKWDRKYACPCGKWDTPYLNLTEEEMKIWRDKNE